MRHVYLLRHAKSSWDEPGLADHDRPLAPRGRRAAKLLATYLREEGIEPGLVLCSSARRTRETLEGIAPALGDGVRVQVEDELYHAAGRDLLVRLHAVPDGVRSAMLIGHNPAIQELTVLIAGAGEGLPVVARRYPTGALARLTFTGSWRDLAPGAAQLAGFVRPKDLG